MNRNKKVSLLVVLALVTSLFAGCLTAFAEQHYTDVDDAHWAATYVNYMHEKGYVHGYPDGTYLPGNNITRAEIVTILNYITGSTTPAANQFTDNIEGDWYFNQINCAVQAGYLHGYGDGTVRPNSFITREEAAVLIAQAYKAKLDTETEFADMDQVSDWALPYVKLMKEAEMVEDNSDNRFRPKDNLLRAEVAAMVYGIEKGIEGDVIETVEVVLPKDMTLVENQDGSFKFNDAIGIKNTNNKLSVIIDVAENTAGDFTVTYTKDNVEHTVTPEELKAVVFTENELQAANFVFKFKDPKDGTSAKISIKVTDDGKDVSNTQTYEFTFGAAPSVKPTTAPGGGGSIGGGGIVDKLDETEDRVVKALTRIKSGEYGAINNGSKYLSDPIEIILANDGMDVADITSPQASKADQGKEELKKYVNDEKYALLKDVYADVIQYVVNKSEALKKVAEFTTETKKEYVLYFRAMIAVVDTAADSAVKIYNDDQYTSAQAKYDAFIKNVPNDVISKIDEVLASMPDSELKNEIKIQATSYCLEMFTKGQEDKESIQEQLSKLTDGLTLEVLAAILKDHLVMA